MPKPIPPPPPQATEAETRLALRWVFAVMGGTLLLYLAIASTYGLDNVFVDYGRDDVVTWVEWKRDRLRMKARREHEGGRVVWLVGSSIMRASFSEGPINEALAERGAPWRVIKFGFARGAPGQAEGFLRTLPVREGDLVVFNAYVANFQRGWVKETHLPHLRVVHLNGLRELWRLPELSVQEKLEASCGLPEAFWNYHAEYMAGLSKWLLAPIDGVPKLQKSSSKLTGNTKHLRFGNVEFEIDAPEEHSRYIAADTLDFSLDQYNALGVARARELATAAGAEFMLVHVPPTRAMQTQLWGPGVSEQWQAWLQAQGALELSQLPEDDFLDLNHPNRVGRETLSAELVEWLAARP
ncbi:MAG: hypothetical protein H6740_04585 [Alphaproteobacteria bacterium]|nr:hypothetical protein [Alphaproteobacteria bacterium]